MVVALLLSGAGSFLCRAQSAAESKARRRAERTFLNAREHYQFHSTNSQAAIAYVHAAFDWAEFAESNSEREDIAEEVIPVCRKWTARDPKLAGAHYYLAMNLGQLARTKSFGALKLVDEMEPEFQAAIKYDEHLDFAGPDRNLGQLYLEAPLFSVGDKKKSRQHLERAVEIEPVYPDNQLLLAEALLRWGDKKSAQKVLSDIEGIWPKAKEKFAGEDWEWSWIDWEARLQKIKAKLSRK
jgi:tetratricopeptide (TPR) repeat protein